MGNAVSKKNFNLLNLTHGDQVFSNKCNMNTKSWIRFANLKAKLHKNTEKDDIKQFPKKNNKIKVNKLLGLEFILKENNENSTSLGIVESLFSDVVKFMNDEKFSDMGYEFVKNNDIALEMTKTEFHKCLPTYDVKWKNWNSLETFKHLIFCGLGQVYLEKTNLSDQEIFSNAEYKIDFKSWEKYEVRPSFENYGSIAYFSKSFEPLGFKYFENIITVNDKNFSHIYFIFRSTLITSVTLRDHLILVHWIAANSILVASVKYLGSSHILRRLLKIFTFGTSSINHASTITLAPFEGIAGRTFGFTKNSWLQMINDQLKTIKYQSIYDKFNEYSLPEELKNILPFYKDGIDLWEINHRFITKLLNIYYPTEESIFEDLELIDYWNELHKYFTTTNYNIGKLTKSNLINHLTYSIFNVTAGHSVYGSVCEYLLTPDALMPKVLKNTPNYPNVISADIQTHLQALCIISLTSSPMPELINDWEFIFDCPQLKNNNEKYLKLTNCLKYWQNELNLQIDRVNSRNIIRIIAFDSFNPKILDCSVSV